MNFILQEIIINNKSIYLKYNIYLLYNIYIIEYLFIQSIAGLYKIFIMISYSIGDYND